VLADAAVEQELVHRALHLAGGAGELVDEQQHRAVVARHDALRGREANAPSRLGGRAVEEGQPEQEPFIVR
jgi:hypothetical protein